VVVKIGLIGPPIGERKPKREEKLFLDEDSSQLSFYKVGERHINASISVITLKSTL